MNSHWLVLLYFLLPFLIFQLIDVYLQCIVLHLQFLGRSLELVHLLGHLSDLVTVLEDQSELLLKLLLQLLVAPLGVGQEAVKVAVLVTLGVRHQHDLITPALYHHPGHWHHKVLRLGAELLQGVESVLKALVFGPLGGEELLQPDGVTRVTVAGACDAEQLDIVHIGHLQLGHFSVVVVLQHLVLLLIHLQLVLQPLLPVILVEVVHGDRVQLGLELHGLHLSHLHST